MRLANRSAVFTVRRAERGIANVGSAVLRGKRSSDRQNRPLLQTMPTQRTGRTQGDKPHSTFSDHSFDVRAVGVCLDWPVDEVRRLAVWVVWVECLNTVDTRTIAATLPDQSHG
jgi:hypothetical protein